MSSENFFFNGLIKKETPELKTTALRKQEFGQFQVGFFTILAPLVGILIL